MDVELVVGRNIRRMRLDLGLSQESLAFDVGIAARHLGRIERGTISATVGMLARIADALGCTIGDMLEDGERPMPANLPRGRGASATSIGFHSDDGQADYQADTPADPEQTDPDPDIEALRDILHGGPRGKYSAAAEEMVADLVAEIGGEEKLTHVQRENIQLARAWALARDTQARSVR